MRNKLLGAFVITYIQEINHSKKSDNDLIDHYKTLVSKAAKNGLSKQTMEMIRYIESFDNYNSEVAEELDKNGCFFESVLICLCIQKRIDFTRKEVLNSIQEKKVWLVNHINYFSLLRIAVSKSPKGVVENYSFLFDDECPVITKNEVYEIISNNGFSIPLLVKIVSSNLVAESEGAFLCELFNSERRTNAVAFLILLFISSFPPSVASYCFNSINFDNLRYRSFAYAKRVKIKDVFNPILELDEPSNKIRFMTKTKCLDSDFEKAIKDELKNDQQLANEYIDAIQVASERSITLVTIENICTIRPKRSMPSKANELLFKCKEYEQYVVSKTLSDGYFSMESGERGQTLWPEYVRMFKYNSVKEITDFMGNNNDFLRRVMYENDFSGMNRYSRLKLTNVFQTSDSLYDVVESNDTNYAEEYFAHIAGFADEMAAISFLSIVNKNDTLARSDKVYYNTYDKLVSPSLKAKYTRIRRGRGR